MPEDYYLDKQQREYLLKDLATLLEHIHDLDNVLTRQTRYHGQCRNSAETPLPFSVKASNLQHELAAALPGICETLGYITHLTSNLAIVDCLHWLQENYMTVAAFQDASKLADDIAGWARRIVLIVDRPKYPDFIGVCPECGETIYSCHNRGEITCVCGAVLDAVVLRSACVERLDREYFTRKELRNYLTERGVPKSTQNRWLKEISSVDYGGRSYWLMGDVVEKLRERLRGCNA